MQLFGLKKQDFMINKKVDNVQVALEGVEME
jgi:hypothetical protein